MKSYLVTISRGASYTPIIESVIAESQMQAMNHVIKKHRPNYISFINAIESDVATCVEDNLFDLKLKDCLYVTETTPTYKDESKDESKIFTFTLDGQQYTVDMSAIMQDLTNTKLV